MNDGERGQENGTREGGFLDRQGSGDRASSGVPATGLHEGVSYSPSGGPGVNPLVTDFADMLESTVGARVNLQINLRRKLPPVQVDPVHLETALLNVVLDARDAMPRHEG